MLGPKDIIDLLRSIAKFPQWKIWMCLCCWKRDFQVGRDPGGHILVSIIAVLARSTYWIQKEISYCPISCLMPLGSRKIFRTIPRFPSAPTKYVPLIDFSTPSLFLYFTNDDPSSSSILSITSQPLRRSQKLRDSISRLSALSSRCQLKKFALTDISIAYHNWAGTVRWLRGNSVLPSRIPNQKTWRRRFWSSRDENWAFWRLRKDVSNHCVKQSSNPQTNYVRSSWSTPLRVPAGMTFAQHRRSEQFHEDLQSLPVPSPKPHTVSVS